MSKDIDADLERFYARNPSVSKTAPAPETGRSPLDMGTLTRAEVLEGLTIQTMGDVNFLTELLPALRKRLVWDIVPDEAIPGMSRGMGITPGSEEGDVIEQEDAAHRRSLLNPLMPLLRVAGLTAGEVVSRAKMLVSDPEAATDSNVLVVDPEYDVQDEVLAGVYAVVANLLDLGVIRLGKGVE